jgi:uncharacterized membrane protein
LDPSQTELQEIRQALSDLASRVLRLEEILQLRHKPAPVAPVAATPVTTQPLPSAVAPPPFVSPPSVQARAGNADLESRIGSHWLNRIGITAVLIGVSYFLKFAFDSDWIGAGGRIAIGLLAGIGVVVWSERFRGRGYRAFSYSLKAVGTGVMYLALWAGFQVYHLFPSGVAFLAMLIVTASTAALALSQDAEILAAFALTGGFATPALLSTGQNREIALFAYVALLDFAALVLVTFKPWQRLLLLAYAGTLFMYIGWYSQFYSRNQLWLTVFFATLFFVAFAIAPLLVRPLDSSTRFAALPFFIAFVNAGVYFFQMYAMLDPINKTAPAWVALALAAVYIGLSRQGRSRASAETLDKLRLLHLALAIVFITIAIPIRLEEHWITIGWFVEAAVLLWVSDRIKSDFLAWFAICALLLGVCRMVFVDDFITSTLIFNSRMATYLIAIAALAWAAWLASRRTGDMPRKFAAVAVVVINLLALMAISHEIHDFYSEQMARAAPDRNARNSWSWGVEYHRIQIARDFTYSTLFMAYGAMLMAVGFWRRSAFVRWQALFLIAATVVKVFVYDVSELDRVYRILSFIVLGVLLLAISFAYQRDWLKLSSRPAPPGPAAA